MTVLKTGDVFTIQNEESTFEFGGLQMENVVFSTPQVLLKNLSMNKEILVDIEWFDERIINVIANNSGLQG